MPSMGVKRNVSRSLGGIVLSPPPQMVTAEPLFWSAWLISFGQVIDSVKDELTSGLAPPPRGKVTPSPTNTTCAESEMQTEERHALSQSPRGSTLTTCPKRHGPLPSLIKHHKHTHHHQHHSHTHAPPPRPPPSTIHRRRAPARPARACTQGRRARPEGEGRCRTRAGLVLLWPP